MLAWVGVVTFSETPVEGRGVCVVGEVGGGETANHERPTSLFLMPGTY